MVAKYNNLSSERSISSINIDLKSLKNIFNTLKNVYIQYDQSSEIIPRANCFISNSLVYSENHLLNRR